MHNLKRQRILVEKTSEEKEDKDSIADAMVEESNATEGKRSTASSTSPKLHWKVMMRRKKKQLLSKKKK